MTSPICKTFTYNNYAEADAQDEAKKASKSIGDSFFGNFYEEVKLSKRIEVELTYCDEMTESICNREIVTKIKQNFSPDKFFDKIYQPGNQFEIMSQIRPGSRVYTRGEGFSSYSSQGTLTREQRYYTGCFDWDVAFDGHEHIRKLAVIELPGLEPKPYVPSESIPECIPDKPVKGQEFTDSKQNDIFQEETVERLNDAALAAFALMAVSVVGYGMYSLYKRCTA